MPAALNRKRHLGRRGAGVTWKWSSIKCSDSGGKYVKNVSQKPLIKFTGHIPEMPQATSNTHTHLHTCINTPNTQHNHTSDCTCVVIEIYPPICVRVRVCIRIEGFPLKQRNRHHHFIVFLLNSVCLFFFYSYGICLDV